MAGKPGSVLKQTHQLELVPIKQEPAPTDSITAGNEPHKDALALPDIKPDMATLHKGDCSFISRVAKGSKRILIEEYPTTKTPSAGGKETKSYTQAIKVPSMLRAITTRTPTGPDDRNDRHRGNQCLEPCTTVAITERTTRQTVDSHELDIERGDDDTATRVTQQDEKGIIPNNAPQTFVNDENEHRKRRHQFGISPGLL